MIDVLNCTATMYVTVQEVYDSIFLDFLFPFPDLFNCLREIMIFCAFVPSEIIFLFTKRHL